MRFIRKINYASLSTMQTFNEANNSEAIDQLVVCKGDEFSSNRPPKSFEKYLRNEKLFTYFCVMQG